MLLCLTLDAIGRTRDQMLANLTKDYRKAMNDPTAKLPPNIEVYMEVDEILEDGSGGRLEIRTWKCSATVRVMIP